MNLPKANDAWLGVVDRVLKMGSPVTCRGRETLELMGVQSIVDMNHPVVSFASRKLSYEFMFAEAAWILSGSDRVDFLPAIQRNWSKYSDDGVHTAGAYGPKIANQIPFIVDALTKDPFTRQAVINIWRESPFPSKDTACTTSIQFLIRQWRGMKRLHIVVTMRSSDLWLGYPYDIFNFSMVAAWVSRFLPYEVKLGMLCLTAGSQHIYKDNHSKIMEAFYKRKTIQFQPFNLLEFKTPGCLLQHLLNLANRTAVDKNSFTGLIV